MPNPTESFSGSTDGVWLMPYRGISLDSDARAWIAAPPPSEDSEVSRDVFAIPGRRAKVSQRGTLHLAEGEISGPLISRFGISAVDWLARLEDLILHQHLFVVRMVTTRDDFPVELGNLSKSPTHLNGERTWTVDLEFREVS